MVDVWTKMNRMHLEMASAHHGVSFGVFEMGVRRSAAHREGHGQGADTSYEHGQREHHFASSTHQGGDARAQSDGAHGTDMLKGQVKEIRLVFGHQVGFCDGKDEHPGKVAHQKKRSTL